MVSVLISPPGIADDSIGKEWHSCSKCNKVLNEVCYNFVIMITLEINK
jgi:hypothetical protein